MSLVSVYYNNVEGWHRFTSPQIPGFCVIVEPNQFQMGLEDVPIALELIIASDHGKRVTALTLPAYSEYFASTPSKAPKVYHYYITI